MDGPKTVVKRGINPPGVPGTAALVAEKGVKRRENVTKPDEIVPDMILSELMSKLPPVRPLLQTFPSGLKATHIGSSRPFTFHDKTD